MAFIGKTLRVLGYLVLLVAVVVGSIVSGLAGRVGLLRWITGNVPGFQGLQGLFPSTVQLPPGFTFEQLESMNLTGQTALITGANSGVGFGKALLLARQGATVTLVCRTAAKCNQAVEEIKNDAKVQAANPTLDIAVADVSDLTAVRDMVDEYVARRGAGASLDMLFLNAGMVSAPPTEEGRLPLSKDGISIVFATNVVGHHLMYRKLLPLLQRATIGRVVCTSSGANFDTFDIGVATDLDSLNNRPVDWAAYGESKLAQILFTQEVTRRLGSASTIYANSYHPGAVASGIWHKAYWPDELKHLQTVIMWLRDNAMHSIESGALTGVFLGVATDDLKAKNIRGKYFHPQVLEVEPNPQHATNLTLQTNLYKFLDELTEPFVS